MCICPEVVKLGISDGEVLGNTLRSAYGLSVSRSEGGMGIGSSGGVGNGSGGGKTGR